MLLMIETVPSYDQQFTSKKEPAARPVLHTLLVNKDLFHDYQLADLVTHIRTDMPEIEAGNHRLSIAADYIPNLMLGFGAALGAVMVDFSNQIAIYRVNANFANLGQVGEMDRPGPFR